MHGSRSWVPVTHMGDLDGVPGSKLWPGVALAEISVFQIKKRNEKFKT